MTYINRFREWLEKNDPGRILKVTPKNRDDTASAQQFEKIVNHQYKNMTKQDRERIMTEVLRKSTQG